MSRVPHSQQVNASIRALRVAIRRSLKGVNQRAAQRMSRGDYPSAEALVAIAREIQQFDVQIADLRPRWRQIASGGGGRTGKAPTTPVWKYYQPILRAIVAAGGELPPADVEAAVGKAMAGEFQLGDTAAGPRGKERWRVMVQRSRKQLVVEGWLEKRPAKKWRITDAGRRAAERSPRAEK
jgi:hypothetical protein